MLLSTAVLGREVKLKAIGQSSGYIRLKGQNPMS